MRAYSIATTALRRLVVDAVGQLQTVDSVLPKAARIELHDGERTPTKDLNMMLKHVQQSCSL
jgi:hypothetical protein